MMIMDYRLGVNPARFAQATALRGKLIGVQYACSLAIRGLDRRDGITVTSEYRQPVSFQRPSSY